MYNVIIIDLIDVNSIIQVITLYNTGYIDCTVLLHIIMERVCMSENKGKLGGQSCKLVQEFIFWRISRKN